MNRRAFVTGIGAVLAAPLGVDAQTPGNVARVGMLRSERRASDHPRLLENVSALRAGLRDEDYIESQHYRIDYRSPKTEADVPKLAQSLVRDGVNVIHAAGYLAISAARNASKAIPIVAHDYETDPIAAGFVTTLAKPGANVTGMFLDLPEITGKLLELLKTTVPVIRQVGVLWDPFTGSAQRVAHGGCGSDADH